MNVLYFNINNGECVSPYTCLPQYRAEVTGSRIHRIEACFSVSNIAHKGYDWFLEQVEEENTIWSKTHPHLMESLKTLVLAQSNDYPFNGSNFDPDNHRFPFILVWHENKRYTKSYFVPA